MAQKGDKKRGDLKRRLQEVEEKYKRALADYQNLQRRTTKEKEEFLKFAVSSLIAKLLGVLDDLETARKHLKDQGLDLVVRNFQEILKQEGVVEIKSLGEKFDPGIHECLGVVEVKDKSLVDTVVEEVRKGYRIQAGESQQILRYPQVKVGKKIKN